MKRKKLSGWQKTNIKLFLTPKGKPKSIPPIRYPGNEKHNRRRITNGNMSISQMQGNAIMKMED